MRGREREKERNIKASRLRGVVVRERKESERQIKQNNNNQPSRSPVALWFSSSELLSGEGCMKHTWINVVQVHLGVPKNLPGLIK